jgi:hypothetical protein
VPGGEQGRPRKGGAPQSMQALGQRGPVAGLRGTQHVVRPGPQRSGASRQCGAPGSVTPRGMYRDAVHWGLASQAAADPSNLRVAGSLPCAPPSRAAPFLAAAALPALDTAAALSPPPPIQLLSSARRRCWRSSEPAAVTARQLRPGLLPCGRQPPDGAAASFPQRNTKFVQLLEYSLCRNARPCRSQDAAISI